MIDHRTLMIEHKYINACIIHTSFDKQIRSLFTDHLKNK